VFEAGVAVHVVTGAGHLSSPLARHPVTGAPSARAMPFDRPRPKRRVRRPASAKVSNTVRNVMWPSADSARSPSSSRPPSNQRRPPSLTRGLCRSGPEAISQRSRRGTAAPRAN
jgi:hypothetical protein